MCGCIVTKEKKPTRENKVVAVLSTSVMPKDGTYSKANQVVSLKDLCFRILKRIK